MSRHGKYSLWYGLLVSCVVVGILLFGVIEVATAPSNPIFFDPCTTGGENADRSCNAGEDYDTFVIPNPQPADAYLLSGQLATTVEKNNVPLGIQYRGVTLAGGECRNTLGNYGDFIPVDNDAELFIYKGMNTIRVTIRWENIADANGTFLNDGRTVYIQRLDNLINDLSAKNMTIILDLYNDMGYNRQPIIGQNFRALWYNLVLRYPGFNMMYAVMNMVTDRADDYFDRIYAIVVDAVTAIRNAELSVLDENLRGYNHFLLLPLVYLDYHSEFNEKADQYKSIPLINVDRYALDAAKDFLLARGVNRNEGRDVCITLEDYRSVFDESFGKFKAWARETKQKIFVSQVGLPFTTDACKEILAYFLDEIHKFPYNATEGYGIIGWTAWAGGSPGCGKPSPIVSLAPGYPTNLAMWRIYPRYLIEIDALVPQLKNERRYIKIFNNLSVPLVLAIGYVPFQINGSADIPPRTIGYLYSSSNTSIPVESLQTHYAVSGYGGTIGFGYSTGAARTYFFKGENCISIRAFDDASCEIKDSGVVDPRCFVVNKGLNC